MVSCLALIQASHWLMSQRDGLHITACGLALAREHIEPQTFAADAAGVSCKQCQAMGQPPRASESTHRLRPTPKSLLTQLVEDILNANSTAHLAQVAQDRLAATLAPKRLNRLHELFPSWHMTIDDLIAEGDSVFARYRVACIDAFGLLGPPGPLVKEGQALIAQMAGEQLVDVRAIVDDFGIWDGPSGSPPGTDRCAC